MGQKSTRARVNASETMHVEVPFERENIINFVVSVVGYGVEFRAKFVQECVGDESGVAEDEEKEKKKETAGVMLREGGKIKAEGGPVRGEWSVSGPGHVEVTFENTHSMLRSKKVRYKFEVCPVVLGSENNEEEEECLRMSL